MRRAPLLLIALALAWTAVSALGAQEAPDLTLEVRGFPWELAEDCTGHFESDGTAAALAALVEPGFTSVRVLDLADAHVGEDLTREREPGHGDRYLVEGTPYTGLVGWGCHDLAGDPSLARHHCTLIQVEDGWPEGPVLGVHGGHVVSRGWFADGRADGTWLRCSLGGLRSVETFEDGQRSGPTRQYHLEQVPGAPERLEMEGRYADGAWDGLFVEYDRSGEVTLETGWRAGQRHGTLRHHDHGRLVQEETWRDGKRAGPFTAYWGNGAIEEQGSYLADLREGLWHTYYPSGDPRSDTEYRAGEVVSERSLDSFRVEDVYEERWVDGRPAGRHHTRIVTDGFTLRILDWELREDAELRTTPGVLALTHGEPYSEFSPHGLKLLVEESTAADLRLEARYVRRAVFHQVGKCGFVVLDAMPPEASAWVEVVSPGPGRFVTPGADEVPWPERAPLSSDEVLDVLQASCGPFSWECSRDREAHIPFLEERREVSGGNGLSWYTDELQLRVLGTAVADDEVRDSLAIHFWYRPDLE